MEKLKRFAVLLFAVTAIFFVSNFMDSRVVLAAAKVNINTANTTELDTIPEVGPSTAAKIITYRETNGPFAKIEDIMNVSGIKQATFDKMKDYITVDSGSGGTGDSGGTGTTTATTTEETATTTATTTTSVSNNPVTISVHYIQENLSNYTEPTTLEVSAGRERLSYVGSPVSFEAKYKTSADLKGRSPSCTWSFGDGSSVTAEKAIHTYKYSGEYNVVLNATLGGVNSISRTRVKVLIPNLTLSILDDQAVEIINNGTSEINLYGWKLRTQNLVYAFPLDTIISAGKSVTFPVEYLKLPVARTDLALTDASGRDITRASQGLVASDTGKIISQADVEKFTAEYRKLIQAPVPVSAVPLTATVAEALINATTSSDVMADNVDNPTPGEAPVSRGFWSKLFHPIRTIQETFYK